MPSFIIWMFESLCVWRGVCLWCGMHVDVLTDQWWSVCVEGGWYVGVWVWCGIHVNRSVVVCVCWGWYVGVVWYICGMWTDQ